MINRDLFSTYFLVKDNQVSIYVKNNNNSEIVFFKKKKIDKNSNNFFYQEIELFFLEKIEEIESQIELFVENIVLIIEDSDIFSVGLSVKQKIENRKISEEELKNLLSSGLQQIYKYYPNYNIIHYIIDKFNTDGQITKDIENKMINTFLSIDLRFITLENKIVDKYKNLFKKKQIFLEKVISVKYLKEFDHENNDSFINMACKIDDGYNKLEVKLVPKSTKKKGFFESFFLSI
jgi:hypothetical protein